MGALGDNLIRELTGQSDPEGKLPVMVPTHFLEFLLVSHAESGLLLVARLQAKLVMGCHGS